MFQRLLDSSWVCFYYLLLKDHETRIWCFHSLVCWYTIFSIWVEHTILFFYFRSWLFFSNVWVRTWVSIGEDLFFNRAQIPELSLYFILCSNSLPSLFFLEAEGRSSRSQWARVQDSTRTLARRPKVCSYTSLRFVSCVVLSYAG